MISSPAGYIGAGGGILFDSPRGMDRTYLQKYIPFPQGFLADSELRLTRQDGLEYYGFRMGYFGTNNQDYLLEAANLGSSMPKLSMTRCRIFTAG